VTKESKWDVNAIGVIVSPYQVKFETPKQATISRQDGKEMSVDVYVLIQISMSIDIYTYAY
jgi:hypothetical protein